MTALSLRQAVAAICTSGTTPGTEGNPVSTMYFWVPDQIAFADTPALVITSPDEDERPAMLRTNESMLRVEVEYLDSPIDGDDPQDTSVGPLAAMEAWFEQAKANLRINRQGVVDGSANWLRITRMQTVINRPLRDQGRVMYHGCLAVWVQSTIAAGS